MTTPPPGRWGHFLSHYIRHLHIIAMLSDIVVHLQVISCHIQVRHLHLLPVQDKSLYHMYFANNPDKYKKKKSFHCVDSYNLKKQEKTKAEENLVGSNQTNTLHINKIQPNKVKIVNSLVI